MWKENGSDVRTVQSTRAYAEAVSGVVGELNGGEGGDAGGDGHDVVGFVDVWGAVWKAAGEKEEGLRPLFSDGLHFTAAGYSVRASFCIWGGEGGCQGFMQKLWTDMELYLKIVYEALIKVIREDFPELFYANLKEPFPL